MFSLWYTTVCIISWSNLRVISENLKNLITSNNHKYQEHKDYLKLNTNFYL